MVEFLHAEQLTQVRLGLLLVILKVIDVLEPEVFQLFSEVLESVLELLHADSVLLDHFLDGLDLQVDAHLHRGEMLSDDVCDQPPRDCIELFVEVGPLELMYTLTHRLDLLVAVLQDKVLALLHLFDLRELLPDARHRVLRQVFLERDEAALQGGIGLLEACVEPLDIGLHRVLELSQLLLKLCD